jgi:RNA polymerase sigma-70 factor (ECF subfamily)
MQRTCLLGPFGVDRSRCASGEDSCYCARCPEERWRALRQGGWAAILRHGGRVAARPVVSSDTPQRPPMRLSDVELVSGAREHRRDATEQLLQRFGAVPRILMAINVRLGWPLNDHEVEDVCQDTIERLWRKLESFNGTSTLETWFYGVARFEFMNALRRKQRRALEPVDADLREAPDPPPPHRDEFERVHAALAQLIPDDARIVVLHHFDGQTLEQAARTAAIPVSTAKSRYYRGMERLTQLLRERSP